MRLSLVKRRIIIFSVLVMGLTTAMVHAETNGKVMVQWLGHAAFKITSVTGKVILIDPFITNNPKLPEDRKSVV